MTSNSKPETLNPKQTQNTKHKCPKRQVLNFGFCILNLFRISCLLFSVCFFSCGNVSSTGEDYGNLDASPSGLALTQGEHVYGWGESDCTSCHNLNNIHISVSESGYDMAAVRDQVATQGLAACSVCHGTNGVQ